LSLITIFKTELGTASVEIIFIDNKATEITIIMIIITIYYY
jgi:hypothetical protein